MATDYKPPSLPKGRLTQQLQLTGPNGPVRASVNSRFGVSEGVDSRAREGVNVRVILRGRNDGGFRKAGANAPGGRLAITGGTDRSSKRRVINELLIEVNVLVKYRKDDRLEGKGLSSDDTRGSIGRERDRVLNRGWSGGQMDKTKVRLATAISVMEIADTKGRTGLA
jgi:hypothetical protein